MRKFVAVATAVSLFFYSTVAVAGAAPPSSPSPTPPTEWRVVGLDE